MEVCPQIKGTKRDFIRHKRREIKAARKVLDELRFGCALSEVFDGTDDFHLAVCQMDRALKEMDRVTKPLR